MLASLNVAIMFWGVHPHRMSLVTNLPLVSKSMVSLGIPRLSNSLYTVYMMPAC